MEYSCQVTMDINKAMLSYMKTKELVGGDEGGGMKKLRDYLGLYLGCISDFSEKRKFY